MEFVLHVVPLPELIHVFHLQHQLLLDVNLDFSYHLELVLLVDHLLFNVLPHKSTLFVLLETLLQSHIPLQLVKEDSQEELLTHNSLLETLQHVLLDISEQI